MKKEINESWPLKLKPPNVIFTKAAHYQQT